MGVTQLFDEDFDEIIAQSFDKLDVVDDNTLSIKYIRQGLLVNSRTHILPVLKGHNKSLLKYVYDMSSSKVFDRTAYGAYIKTCLEQERERSTISRS